MSLKKSEAVILKSYNWAESSRTVVFFSYEFGRIALIDKGGRSIKSKRGRLLPFSRLEFTFYHSEKESSGYLSEIELIESHTFEKEGTLGRLAYGSAGCELLLCLLPEEEPQRQLYKYFCDYMKMIDNCDKQSLPALFIAFYLRSLSLLGYHPSIAYCATCAKAYPGDQSYSRHLFSGNAGGLVCATCQKPSDYYISLTDEGFRILSALQTASLSEACALPLNLKQATSLIDALGGFLSYQTSVKSELNSLAFIEKLKNAMK